VKDKFEPAKKKKKKKKYSQAIKTNDHKSLWSANSTSLKNQ